MSEQDGNQAFAGQRGFTSGTGNYNRLEFVFRTLAGRMATATLAQVTAVHPGDALKQGTVDVQLLVNQIDSNGNAQPHGIVYGLPYARVQAGACAIIVDPAIGDIGVAVFASRDISSVKVNKAQANPGSFRRFDYADGIYLFSALGAIVPTDYLRLLPSGGLEYADRFDNAITAASAGVTINGVLFPRGGVSFNAKTHTHQQSNDSHGDTEEPTDGPTDGS